MERIRIIRMLFTQLEGEARPAACPWGKANGILNRYLVSGESSGEWKPLSLGPFEKQSC